MVRASVRTIIHSLTLVDYLPVQTHEPYSNYRICSKCILLDLYIRVFLEPNIHGYIVYYVRVYLGYWVRVYMYILKLFLISAIYWQFILLMLFYIEWYSHFFVYKLQGKYVDERFLSFFLLILHRPLARITCSLGARNIYNVILIPQMLLVLAKEIYEWCLIAEDIILLARKIICRPT